MTSAWDPSEEDREWVQQELTVPVKKDPKKPYTFGRKDDFRHLSVVTPERAELAQMPRTRGECKDGPRPCPWLRCKHHLALDVVPVPGASKHDQAGTIRITFPDDENDPDLAGMNDTCSLDVADRGDHTMEEVAALLNVSRQRIEQQEFYALQQIERKMKVFDEP